MKIATLILLALMVVLPSTPLLSDPPQSGDVPAEVESARRALEGAKNDLAHAGGGWGGHRVEAIKHIDVALRELNEAERWAREHHDIR
jgi:hypothetical protein